MPHSHSSSKPHPRCHLRAHHGGLSTVSRLSKTLTQPHGGFRRSILLVSPHIHLVHVPDTVGVFLIKCILTSLSLGRRSIDADFGFSRLEFGLNDLVLKLVNSRLILVRQIDVQFGNFEHLNANVRQIRTALHDGLCYVGTRSAQIHHGQLSTAKQPRQRRFDAHDQLIAHPPQRCLRIPSFLAPELDHKSYWIDDPK
jgi:hypothetical protein